MGVVAGDHDVGILQGKGLEVVLGDGGVWVGARGVAAAPAVLEGDWG